MSEWWGHEGVCGVGKLSLNIVSEIIIGEYSEDIEEQDREIGTSVSSHAGRAD